MSETNVYSAETPVVSRLSAPSKLYGALQRLKLPFFLKEYARYPLILVTVTAAWWLLAHRMAAPELLPAPDEVVRTFVHLAKTGVMAFHVKMSLIRVLKGFCFGIALGFALGVVMGVSKTADKMIGPLFHAVRQVPLLGWMPLIILWCGIGETSRIVFIAIGALYPMVLNTFEGVRSISMEYLEVAKVFEFGWFKLLRKVILPAALPSILTGLRSSLSISWMLVVGAEIFSTSNGGLGDMIWSARELFRMDIVIVGLIVISSIGIGMNKSIELLEITCLRWKRTSH